MSQSSGPQPAPDRAEWSRLAASAPFRELLQQKRRFIVPATVFFVVYYFALPVLVGYFPDLMRTPVFGPVNIAFLFAVSQFVMAWALAFLYIRRAQQFDAMAERVNAQLQPNTVQPKTEVRR